MKTRFHRLGLWAGLAGGLLFQGCGLADQNLIDPDLKLRATLAFVSDLTIFLLENLSAAL